MNYLPEWDIYNEIYILEYVSEYKCERQLQHAMILNNQKSVII